LPNFIVVGAAKSGTTSLYYYLDQHPDVYLSPIKETNYFSSDIDPAEFSEHYTIRRKRDHVDVASYVEGDMSKKRWMAYVQNWDDYVKLFKNVQEESAVGEVSNSYLYSRMAAGNIKKHLPNTKIIMILRNPVERAFSHYVANVRDGHTLDTFRESVDKDYKEKKKGWGISHLFLELGLYSQQVKRFLDTFGRSNVRVYLNDDLKDDSEGLMKDLYEFVGVDSNFRLDFSKRYNVGRVPKLKKLNYFITKYGIKKPLFHLFPKRYKERIKGLFFKNNVRLQLKNEDGEFLLDFFKKDIEKLSDLIDRDLSNWIER